LFFFVLKPTWRRRAGVRPRVKGHIATWDWCGSDASALNRQDCRGVSSDDWPVVWRAGIK